MNLKIKTGNEKRDYGLMPIVLNRRLFSGEAINKNQAY
jgi:hypothetical protein